MSRLKTDAIRNVNASVDGITLDTSGNVAIPNELQLADKIVHTGDTNTFIRFPSDDTVSVETAGSERLRITSAGILEVYPSTNSAGQLNLKRGTSTDQEATFYYGSSYLDIETREATGIRFKTNKQDRVVIDSSGHVGIGRASGLELLDVKGVDDDSIKFSASTYGGGHLRIVGADKTISGTAGPFNYSVRFKTKTQNNNGGNGLEKDALILYHEGWSGNNVASFPNSSVGIGTDNPTFASISGNSEKGLEIHNLGNDTAACLKLTGNNNSGGSPGQETYTQLEHRGGNLTFNINHNGTERFKIDAQGNVHASDGNFVVASGHGIDFSATSDASGKTSELLHDYEEGTFQANIKFGGASANIAHTQYAGRYTKVGRLVTCSFVISLSNKGTSTGEATINALPFTSTNDSEDRMWGLVTHFSPMTNVTSQIVLYNTTNETKIGLYDCSSTGVTAITDANFANNTLIRGFIQYHAA